MPTYTGKRTFDKMGEGGDGLPPGKHSKVQRTCQGAAPSDDAASFIELANQSRNICTGGHTELYAYLWLDETNPYYAVNSQILPTHLQWWDKAQMDRPNNGQMNQYIRNELTLWKEILYTFSTVTNTRVGDNRIFFSDGSPIVENTFDYGGADPDPEDLGTVSNYMIVRINMNQSVNDMKANYRRVVGDANTVICGANQLLRIQTRASELREEAAQARLRGEDFLANSPGILDQNSPNYDPDGIAAREIMRQFQLEATSNAAADLLDLYIQQNQAGNPLNQPIQIDPQDPDSLLQGSLLGSFLPMVEVKIMATQPTLSTLEESVPCDNAVAGEILHIPEVVLFVPAIMLWGLLPGETDSIPIWRPTLSMGRISQANGMPFELIPAAAAPAGAAAAPLVGARRLLQAIKSMPDDEREANAPFVPCLLDIEYSNCPSYSQDEYQCTNKGCTYIMDTGACIGGKYSNSCAMAECSLIGRAPVTYPDLKISAQRREGHEGDCCRDPMNCVGLDCNECSQTMNCEWRDGTCNQVACTVDHCGGAEVANSASGMAPACTCDCKAPAVGNSYCSIPSDEISGCDYYTTPEVSNQVDYNVLAACPNISRQDDSGGNMVLQGDSCTPQCIDLMSKWWVGRNCRCSTQVEAQKNPSSIARWADYDKIADLCGVDRPVCPDEKPEPPVDCRPLDFVSCKAAQDEGYCIWDPAYADERGRCYMAPKDNVATCLASISDTCGSVRPQDPNNPVQLTACMKCGTTDHGRELTQAGCNKDIIGFWCLDQPVTCEGTQCPPGHMVGEPNQIRDFDSHKAGYGCCDRTCSGYESSSCQEGEVLKPNLDTVLESEGCCEPRRSCVGAQCGRNELLVRNPDQHYADEGCCVPSCAEEPCAAGHVRKPNAETIYVEDGCCEQSCAGHTCQPNEQLKANPDTIRASQGCCEARVEYCENEMCLPGQRLKANPAAVRKSDGCCETVNYNNKRILSDCDQMWHMAVGSNQQETCSTAASFKNGKWYNCKWDDNVAVFNDCDYESGDLGTVQLLPIGRLPDENMRPTASGQKHVWYQGLSSNYNVVDSCDVGCEPNPYGGGDVCSDGCRNKIDKYGRVCALQSGGDASYCLPRLWNIGDSNAESMNDYTGGILSTPT